jgi:hypothetical protein
MERKEDFFVFISFENVSSINQQRRALLGFKPALQNIYIAALCVRTATRKCG